MIDAGQDTPLARFTLGELLYKNGDREAAIAHLAEAVRQDAEYSAAWKLYGRVLLEADRSEAAIEALSQGVETAERRGDNQAAKEMRVFLKRARRANG